MALPSRRQVAILNTDMDHHVRVLGSAQRMIFRAVQTDTAAASLSFRRQADVLDRRLLNQPDKRRPPADPYVEGTAAVCVQSG